MDFFGQLSSALLAAKSFVRSSCADFAFLLSRNQLQHHNADVQNAFYPEPRESAFRSCNAKLFPAGVAADLVLVLEPSQAGWCMLSLSSIDHVPVVFIAKTHFLVAFDF